MNQYSRPRDMSTPNWYDDMLTVETETPALDVPSTWQFVAAAKFAGWGFNIGPLNGKAPYTRHGYKDFTTDYQTVTSWWHQWPEANIGARPHPEHVVLDIDVRSGGIDTWKELNAGHILPKTMVTETGTGGFHFWFRLPYRREMNGHAGQGIDVKHNRGYLVMPGSVHPDTGKQYMCISWVAPDDLPVLPTHLRRHVFKPAKPARAIIPQRLRRTDNGANLIQLVLDSREGERNINLNKATFIAAKNGLTILDDLADAARTVGIGEAELAATMRSATTAAQKAGA